MDNSQQQLLEQAKALVSTTIETDGDISAAFKTLGQELAATQQTSICALFATLADKSALSLANLVFDKELTQLSEKDITGFDEQLNYIINTTAQAANDTIDSIETSMPKLKALEDKAKELLDAWGAMQKKELDNNQLRELHKGISEFFNNSHSELKVVNDSLTQVLLAQSYQDLTGQVVKRLIDANKIAEMSLLQLVDLVQQLAEGEGLEASNSGDSLMTGQGPQVNPDKAGDDIVRNQDEVDDLLAQFDL